MKCKRLLALALAAALCIVAAACGTKNNAPDTPTKTDTPPPPRRHPDRGRHRRRHRPGGRLHVPGQVDRLRLTYNGNVSSALYVTSAAHLPGLPGLSAYDDAFFKDHALVLVQASVSSGSVEVGIESVSLKADHTAVVALTHQARAGWHRRHGHMAAVDGGGHRTGGLPVDGGQSGAGVPAVSVLIKRSPTPVCHADGGFSAHFLPYPLENAAEIVYNGESE